MATFTHYQIRRFNTLFSQYATASDEPKPKTKSKPRFRLGPKDLHLLMPRLGPVVSFPDCQHIIQRYDSSCTGALDFEDFTDFVADYEITLRERQWSARNHYRQQVEVLDSRSGVADVELITAARDFVNIYPTEEDYLDTLLLNDPETYFTRVDVLTSEVLRRGVIDDINILRRKIVVRIFGAKGLESHARVKVRPGTGIDYKSIDPFIRVSFAGGVQETTALIGATSPQWDQDLSFNVIIPPGELHEVQQWVERQSFEFSLFDYVALSHVPHVELVATASVPLIRVLLVAHRSLSLVLKMHSLNDAINHLEPIELEISLTDATLERYSWSKLVDSFVRPEEVWRVKYRDKLRSDLLSLCFERGEDEGKNTKSDLDVWAYYTGIADFLYGLFPRRTFQSVALSESNSFHFLPCFVHPAVVHSIRDCTSAAKAVAGIPLAEAASTMSETARSIVSRLPNSEVTKQISDQNWYRKGTGFRMWSSARSSPSVATESFYQQFCSPKAMIFRGKGSAFEHCTLLCDLLLGLGMNAFIALGKAKLRNYCWVVTIEPKTSHSTNEEPPDVTEDSVYTNFRHLAEVSSYNRTVTVTHWDALTGASYQATGAKGFAFERIETLFNHRNIYFNIQKSGIFLRPAFSWNLTDPDCWLQFLSPEAQKRFGSLCAFYSTRDLLPTPLALTAFPYVLEDRSLIRALVDAIRGYRRHILFITRTAFQRSLSSYLQEQIPKMELAANQDFIATHITTTPRPVTSTSNLKEERHHNLQLFEDVKIGAASHAPGGRLVHLYCFRLNRFEGFDELVQDLIETGVLDCSATDTTFAVAAKFFPTVWGSTIWIVVAYTVAVLR